MQRSSRGHVVTVVCEDDPYTALLCRIVQLSVKDARQSKNLKLQHDGWAFLWDVAPMVAEQLMKEELA